MSMNQEHITSDPDTTVVNPEREAEQAAQEGGMYEYAASVTALLKKDAAALSSETVDSEEQSETSDLSEASSTEPSQRVTPDIPGCVVQPDENGIYEGMLIDGSYCVTERMKGENGEADLYLCESGDRKFVLKLYKRTGAPSVEILTKLSQIDSPYIISPVSFGEIGNFRYELVPYCPCGSLKGRRYTCEELCRVVVPEINNALRVLHEHGIIHNDIKPSNILLREKDALALTDFGVSAEVYGENGACSVPGLTLSYSAPEVKNGGTAWYGSDYYSLGITLYELLSGELPMADMPEKDRELYLENNSVMLPDSIPEQISELISGLTFSDADSSEAFERRWTYSKVAEWCEKNKSLTICGTSEEPGISDDNNAPCVSCADEHELVWEGRHYDSAVALGEEMLEKLRICDLSDSAFWDTVLENRLASAYFEGTGEKEASDSLISAAAAQELYSAAAAQRERLVCYWLLAFSLCKRAVYTANDGTEFEELSVLRSFMQTAYDTSADAFRSICYALVDENLEADPMLEAWIIAKDGRKGLERWKAEK